MFYNGTIVITDPCYLMKDTSKKIPLEYEVQRPQRADYLSFVRIVDYPDAIPKEPWEYDSSEMSRIEREIEWSKKGLNRPIYVPMKSKQYETEFQRLLDAEFEWEKPYMGDWEKSNMGKEMSLFGFTAFMSSSTFYGDWGCTTYNLDNKEIIGEFCADGGMVAVFYYDEAVKYNSEFIEFIKEHPWCVTVIKDFYGDVEFKITEELGGVFKEDGRGHHKGDAWFEKTLEIVGKGNINFIGTQTSL